MADGPQRASPPSAGWPPGHDQTHGVGQQAAELPERAERWASCTRQRDVKASATHAGRWALATSASWHAERGGKGEEEPQHAACYSRPSRMWNMRTTKWCSHSSKYILLPDQVDPFSELRDSCCKYPTWIARPRRSAAATSACPLRCRRRIAVLPRSRLTPSRAPNEDVGYPTDHTGLRFPSVVLGCPWLSACSGFQQDSRSGLCVGHHPWHRTAALHDGRPQWMVRERQRCLVCGHGLGAPGLVLIDFLRCLNTVLGGFKNAG